MASEAQKGVFGRRARLRRPDEPTEPAARPAGLYVGNQWIVVGVEIGSTYNKTERAQFANHVTPPGARLEDRTFDLYRTAERRHDPARVNGEVFLTLEALETARRDVAKIAGAVHAQGLSSGSSPHADCRGSPSRFTTARSLAPVSMTQSLFDPCHRRHRRSPRKIGGRKFAFPRE